MMMIDLMVVVAAAVMGTVMVGVWAIEEAVVVVATAGIRRVTTRSCDAFRWTPRWTWRQCPL